MNFGKKSSSDGSRAYRGGNFGYAGSDDPAAYRSYNSTDDSFFNIGFRVSLF